MLNRHEIAQYLLRIEYTQPVRLDRCGLDSLVRAQLTHIPFENLDVWAQGICPSLDKDKLFEKIILHRRGGYCFELNTLFRIFLNSLGFDAYQCIARLIHPDRMDPPAHNVIICMVDGKKFLIDVGFGGAVPFGAMELREGADNGFFLRCEQTVWHLERTDGEKPSLCFRDIPAEVAELVPLNFYISQKPDSHFRHILRCNLRHPDGSVHTLVDSTLQVRRNGENEAIPVENLTEVLEKHFYMDGKYIKLRA